MRHMLMVGALGSALALAGPAPVRAGQAAARPRLDGAWTLNHEMGDRMGGGAPGGEGGRREGAGGGGGHHRGGFGMGGGGMGGGMRPMGGMGGNTDQDRQEMERRRALMRELIAPSERLAIATDGDLVSFTDAEGHVRKYTANGKKEKHQFTNGTVQTKTKWDEDHLVIESSLDGGMKLTQTYGLTAETHQLIVQTKMEGGPMDDDRPPVTHYYDDASQGQ
jgi:hypothetical protein